MVILCFVKLGATIVSYASGNAGASLADAKGRRHEVLVDADGKTVKD